jgi:hypothetical protein
MAIETEVVAESRSQCRLPLSHRRRILFISEKQTRRQKHETNQKDD